jgi:predicted DNA-binding helix-hairpin-helix protein
MAFEIFLLQAFCANREQPTEKSLFAGMTLVDKTSDFSRRRAVEGIILKFNCGVAAAETMIEKK